MNKRKEKLMHVFSLCVESTVKNYLIRVNIYYFFDIQIQKMMIQSLKVKGYFADFLLKPIQQSIISKHFYNIKLCFMSLE